MSQYLKELSENLIKTAQKYGATAAESIVIENKSLSIEVKNQALEKVEKSDALDLGIRVFINSQSACASISSTNKEAIDEMIQRAIAMAKESTTDKYSHPASSHETVRDWNQDDFVLFDETYESQKFQTFKDLTLEIESSALETKAISQCESTGFGSNLSDFHFASSNGFSGGYKKTAFQLFCSAIAGEGSSMERDYSSEQRTFFNDLPPPAEIGQLAAKRAIERLNPRRPRTGLYPVIFDQRISGSLIGHLTSAINGEAICRGSSWLLNSLNKKILSDSLTLCENPKRPKISGSRPFDGEGLMTTKKNFIENGILKHYILDLRTARKLKLEPTGNAYRSLSSAPQPSVGNLELSQGENSVKELIGNIKEGLLVTSLIGSTINQNTGDYSRGANGFWIENGEIVFPVNECTIAGNLKEMLLNIVAANDGKEYLSKVIPSLLVNEMTIAGG